MTEHDGPGVSEAMRNIVLGTMGAALGMCAAIWLGYMVTGPVQGAQSPSTTPATAEPER